MVDYIGIYMYGTRRLKLGGSGLWTGRFMGWTGCLYQGTTGAAAASIVGAAPVGGWLLPSLIVAILQTP
eukprot:scaffold142029_cov19-Prasinocladus_malaysianus.AAC.1